MIESFLANPRSFSSPVVLVVEDEAILRMIAVDLIGGAGIKVLEASNADHAIEILEERGDIRVLFTDIQMPGGKDGVRLAYHVRDRWPSIQIILTSGNVKPNEVSLPTGCTFLTKPYQYSHFVELIRQSIA